MSELEPRQLPLGRLLGSGKEAEVHEYGDCVAKLYKPHALKRSAFREAAILAFVESLGLPAPKVEGVGRFGDRWAVLMGRADGPLFADAMRRDPAAIPAHLAAMAALHTRIHAAPAEQLASLKARLAGNIARATMLNDALRSDLLQRLAAMPDGDRLCHGDFHPANIAGPLGGETILDWLDATRGDPLADVCRTYVLIKPVSAGLAAAYVEAYAALRKVRRDDIMNWTRFVAAARLAEGLPDQVDGLTAMAGGKD